MEGKGKEEISFFGVDREIRDLMIVGESDTSVRFSQGIMSMTNFTRVVHVIKSQDALNLLLQEKFPVIIIDDDAEDVDIIQLSNHIRRDQPLTRIIVISSMSKPYQIKCYINEGSIDAFIHIPDDGEVEQKIPSVIIEQQSRFEINSMINDLVTKQPPKFSPRYFLLEDPSITPNYRGEVEFLGCVITYESVTKYLRFFSDFLKSDQYLIAGYISAVSLMGSQLFRENTDKQEINLAGVSIILHMHDQMQFMFFFKNLNQSSYEAIEPKLNQIIQSIIEDHEAFFISNRPLDQMSLGLIDNYIEELKFEKQDDLNFDRQQNIVIFGNQLPKLNTILYEKKERYNIHRLFDTKDFLDFMLLEDVDVVIINQVLKSDEWNFSISSQAKDIQPSIQIIALLRSLDVEYLRKILNNDYIDFVLHYSAPKKEIIQYLDNAFRNAVKIKGRTGSHYPHNLQYSLHQSTIARSELRKNRKDYQLTNIPELYGLFIARGDLPYFCQLWPAGKSKISFDENLFAGFINSMESLSDEMFDINEEFQGMKFGGVKIIKKRKFDFSFVFFLGGIDHTNYLGVDRALSNSSHQLFDIILNTDFFEFNNGKDTVDTGDRIHQEMVKVHMGFSTLNFLA